LISTDIAIPQFQVTKLLAISKSTMKCGNAHIQYNPKQAYFIPTSAKYTVGSQTCTKVLDFSPSHKCINISFKKDDSNSIACKSNLVK